MCYNVLRQLLLVVFIFTVKGTSLTKIVNLISMTCDVECKFPQPRSVVVAHEIKIEEDTLPYMTVLHRCDEGSGCCSSKGSVCKVAKADTLNATILVKDRETKKFVTKFYEIRNHTQCSCQNASDTRD